MPSYSILYQALVRHPDVHASLSPSILRRYAAGEIPSRVRWLIQYPAVLRTIAELVEESEGGGKVESTAPPHH